MDEDFAFFIKNFGPGAHRLEVPELSIARYKNKLPDQLISYWKDQGWCGYGNGIFWTVNPEDYEGVLTQWIEDSGLNFEDDLHVVARSAFGGLYVWGERGGYCLTISSYLGRYSRRTSRFTGENVDFGVRVFFSSMDPKYNDVVDLFAPAMEKLGILNSDEIYGFVPALALGGSMDLKYLQKVKVIEHLEFISQLSPLTDWGFPKI